MNPPQEPGPESRPLPPFEIFGETARERELRRWRDEIRFMEMMSLRITQPIAFSLITGGS